MLTTGVNLVSQTDEIKEGMPELKCSVENKASVDEKTEKLEQKVEREKHLRYVVCGRESVTTRQKNEAIAGMEKAKKQCAWLKDQMVLMDQMNECLAKTVEQQRMIMAELRETIKGLRKDAKACKMIMGFIKYMKGNKRQRVAGGAKAAADDDEDFGMEDEEEEEDNQEQPIEPNETSKDIESEEEEEKDGSDSDDSM